MQCLPYTGPYVRALTLYKHGDGVHCHEEGELDKTDKEWGALLKMAYKMYSFYERRPEKWEHMDETWVADSLRVVDHKNNPNIRMTFDGVKISLYLVAGETMPANQLLWPMTQYTQRCWFVGADYIEPAEYGVSLLAANGRAEVHRRPCGEHGTGYWYFNHMALPPINKDPSELPTPPPCKKPKKEGDKKQRHKTAEAPTAPTAGTTTTTDSWESIVDLCRVVCMAYKIVEEAAGGNTDDGTHRDNQTLTEATIANLELAEATITNFYNLLARLVASSDFAVYKKTYPLPAGRTCCGNPYTMGATIVSFDTTPRPL